MKNIKKKEDTICIFGLGYVGLPLAVEFGKKISTIGFDISETKIRDLKNKISRDKIVTSADFKNSQNSGYRCWLAISRYYDFLFRIDENCRTRRCN